MRHKLSIALYCVLGIASALGYIHLFVDDPAPDIGYVPIAPDSLTPEERAAWEALSSFGEGIDEDAKKLTDSLSTSWTGEDFGTRLEFAQTHRSEIERLWMLLAPDRERARRILEADTLIDATDPMDFESNSISSQRRLARASEYKAYLLVADGAPDAAVRQLTDCLRLGLRGLESSAVAINGLTHIACIRIAHDGLKTIIANQVIDPKLLAELRTLAAIEFDEYRVIDRWFHADLAFLHSTYANVAPGGRTFLGAPLLLPNATTNRSLEYRQKAFTLIEQGQIEDAKALYDSLDQAHFPDTLRNPIGKTMLGTTAINIASMREKLQTTRARTAVLQSVIDAALRAVRSD